MPLQQPIVLRGFGAAVMWLPTRGYYIGAAVVQTLDTYSTTATGDTFSRTAYADSTTRTGQGDFTRTGGRG